MNIGYSIQFVYIFVQFLLRDTRSVFPTTTWRTFTWFFFWIWALWCSPYNALDKNVYTIRSLSYIFGKLVENWKNIFILKPSLVVLGRIGFDLPMMVHIDGCILPTAGWTGGVLVPFYEYLKECTNRIKIGQNIYRSGVQVTFELYHHSKYLRAPCSK